MGPLRWADDELVDALERCHEAGLGAKFHATGDRAVRQALNAVQVIRERHGTGPMFHIAHVAYIAPPDLGASLRSASSPMPRRTSGSPLLSM